MYFPYFYTKQSERDALIDVAPHLGGLQRVFPILEPYTPPNDLTKLLDTFLAAGVRTHLVVNPTRGAFQTLSAQAAFPTATAPYVAQLSLVIPTMHVFTGTTASDVSGFLAAYPNREVAFVVLGAGLPPKDFATALGSRVPRVFISPGVNVTDYRTGLAGVPVVALESRFTTVTNALYPSESPFCLDPKSYSPDGFGDFTILNPKPPRYPSGGGNGAGAVAVHMTFQDPTSNELRVQHFLSDDRIAGAPPVGVKLLQAIAHLDAEQAKTTPGRFLASPGFNTLHQFGVDGHETNLGKSKQQQLSHHVFTVAKTL
ncbi:sce7725 family protein [Curtobacterium sp. 9128]|uniref:sce7725 family protein n=1 Tax=Curtobacterium sp. 9128 TaxID=1793722 RepID=UPI0016435C34|nr:sce7725 family protein [Curtobacterium sp. 9128]